MEVQGRGRRTGRPKIRLLDSVRDDIREKGLLVKEPKLPWISTVMFSNISSHHSSSMSCLGNFAFIHTKFRYSTTPWLYAV